MSEEQILLEIPVFGIGPLVQDLYRRVASIKAQLNAIDPKNAE